MSQTTADTRPRVAAAAIEMEGAPRSAPLSPHLSIWGWNATNLTSILHRATGIANAAGFLLLTAWLVGGAIGEDAYLAVRGVLGSPLGLLVLFGFTLSVMYHMTNGVRHLIWDSGHMLGRGQRRASAYAVYAVAILLTVGVIAAGFAASGA